MAQALQLAKEKNPAVQRIADMLVKSFDEIGEKIRADLLKAYRENADHWHKKFLEAAQTLTGPIVPRDDYGRRTPSWYADWYRHTELVKKKTEYYTPDVRNWEDVRKLKGQFRVTYKYADERANESYENARDSFVHKNLDKLREVMGDRTDLKSAVIKFDWVNRSYFRGNLQVYLEGANFRGDVDVKYVVRTIPRVTPYFQYPLVFVEAEIGGKLLARPSEEELRQALGGGTKEQYAAKKEAEKLAAGFCPGGGKQVDSKVWRQIYNRMSKWTTCPDCGQGASVSSGGKFLQHKTKAAVKLSAAQKLTEAGYCPMSKEKVPAEIIAQLGPVDGYKDPKGLCPACKQQIRMQAEKEWIRDQFLTPGTGYPTKMKVESAYYLKHKLAK
jgi:hypothetical protein